MKQLVHLTFSVTEGNMIHDALSEAGAERALARRFPHTWLFPVEDESLYNAVWEGDTSMSLDIGECWTISDALSDRSRSRFEAGYELISYELSSLAWKIRRAAYSVLLGVRSAGKEEGDVPTRNPSPEAAPDEATPMDENTISVRLTDAQMGKLVELTVAHNMVNEAKGVTPDWGTQDSLAVFLRPENLDEEIRLIFSLLDEPQSERDGGEGDVPTRNPSPEAAPDEELETLVSVCDASGVVRDVTLDEAEAMREAAQGIYEGEPPEPQIIEDRTDAYFRLLGIADWPETPCAGDYGLSDCLAEPSEATLDFVDAFCVHS